MLLLLLACTHSDLEQRVKDLEESIDAHDTDAGGDWDTAHEDTGWPEEVEPQPGDMTIALAQLDTPYWQADVVLSEVAEASLWVTGATGDGLIADRRWTGECTRAAWDYHGEAEALLVVVEVEWTNGAYSCQQLVGQDATPIDDCEIVQARSASCE